MAQRYVFDVDDIAALLGPLSPASQAVVGAASMVRCRPFHAWFITVHPQWSGSLAAVDSALEWIWRCAATGESIWGDGAVALATDVRDSGPVGADEGPLPLDGADAGFYMAYAVSELLDPLYGDPLARRVALACEFTTTVVLHRWQDHLLRSGRDPHTIGPRAAGECEPFLAAVAAWQQDVADLSGRGLDAESVAAVRHRAETVGTELFAAAERWF